MKILLAFLLLAVAAIAQETVNVTLTWDANIEPDLAGYRLYVGTSSQTYGPAIIVDGTVKTIALPKDTLHYAVVKAVNTSGLESGPSNELAFQVFRAGEGKAPSAPTNLRKPGPLQVSIEQSSDLMLWASIHTQMVPTHTESMFYRLTLESKANQ